MKAKDIIRGKFKIVTALVMAASLVVSGLSVSAVEVTAAGKTAKVAAKVNVPEGRVYITSKKYNLVPGATETVLTTNNKEGTDQKIGFIMKFDADALKDGSIKAVATYKDYEYDGNNFGMQTVTDQAKAYEKKNKDEKVIAGINASFYNLNTGEPTGAFVMGGQICKEANGQPYLAILKDGSAVIRTSKDLSDVQDAVCGDMQIVTDGQVTVQEGDYQTLQYSRCAVGITAEGDIITYTTHGVSAPTSCGETYVDVAKNLVAAGCVQAINVDGGGSATSCSIREGEGALTVKNNPSDGTPRTVSTSLLFASTKSADGIFDHAALEPNNEYYTPSTAGLLNAFNKNETTVQFTATGIDGSGAACDLPEGLTWAVAEESKDMGTIDAATGLFTAAVDALGEVTVNLLDGTEVVGTTNIVLAEPEEIAFSGTGISLDFSEETDLGLTVKGQGVALNYKDGDFTWEMDNDKLGTIEGNIFKAAPKQDTSIEGNITVTYEKADGSKVSESIYVEVGKMPIVAMDFEDVETNGRGKDVVGLWDWGAAGKFFTDADGDQIYKFQNYDILYYLQSTTYSSDKKWINEIYETEQPWTEHEDGKITVEFNGKEYVATKEATYGEHAQKWISFTDENGDGYYWRGYIEGDSWSGNYNAGGGSASAILGADGYQMYVWHTNANPTVLASGDLHGEGSQIVDSSEGEVRFGEHALKLTYDYRNFSPISGTKNCNTYYRMTEPLVAQGSPSGLGMWVYAPESMDNFWFWTAITCWNGTDWVDVYPHFKPAGAEKSCQYTGVNWTGWTYVEADLTPVYEAGAIVDAEHPLQVRSGNALIQMTYIPGGTSDGEGHAIVMGSKTKGEFYIDNVRWVYGTNVDDMDNPQIINVTANDTVLSTDEKANIAVNDIVFDINYTDPQGENYSGIDVQATQIYLDGSPLSNTTDYSASADRAQTAAMKLANGEHTLMVSICDNFGNKTEQNYRFVVNNEYSKIPTVSIVRDEKAELGGDYVVKVAADRLADIENVSTTIIYGNTGVFEPTSKYLENNKFYDDYGNVLTLGSDNLYYDANGNLVDEPVRPNATGYYKVSDAVQKLGGNLTGKIRNKTVDNTTRAFTATAKVNEYINRDGTILTFTLPIPNNLTEDVKLPISISVTYTSVDGDKYTVTTGDMTKDIYAYYTVEPGIQVSGAEASVLNITTADDKAVSADTVKVYDGTTEVEGTFTDNTFSTAYFVGKEAGYTTKNVRVVDAENKHYSYATQVSVSDGAVAKEDILHYDVALHATSKDSTTSEEITWISAYSAGTDVVAQYVTKAAYDAVAEGTDPFADAKSVEGTSKLRNFATEGKVARVNAVEITDLTPGTTYVFRVGDGINWSETGEFTTMDKNGITKFMVMADVQLGSSMTETDKKYFQGIGDATRDVDFGLQTGDFTDNPDSFVEWDNVLQTWSDVFAGKDFVRVIGNHEVYGTGAANSLAILGMDEEQPDYYSVEYGNVYVAVINQTADLNDAAEWLIEDAAKTDCTWKVVSCHQPIYFTNPNGSSDGHHKVLKVACDKAGIDFTFSGHDHSYARTEQLKDGKPVALATDETTNAYVDENGQIVATQGEGTVYMICGDLGEKSREDGYKIVNNPDFHFAQTSQDYDALFLAVDADTDKFTVNTWNLHEDGSKDLLDTYTMYTNAGICKESGEHLITMDEAVYNPETGKLICERCHTEVDPVEAAYTGFATSKDGEDEYGDSQYYFLAGNVRTEFFVVDENIWYANEDGLIDHTTENKNTNTCTENGNRTAYSPRYEKSYTGGKVPFTGHNYETKEDGSLVCKTCEHKAIDIADWNFSLSYTSTSYNGKFKYPAIKIENPATGETLEYATDGMGRLTDYTRIWKDNKEVGTATVSVAANPESDYFNSKGEVVLTLRINPPVPGNVTVGNVTETTAEITWDAADKATGYYVYQNKNSKWVLVGDTTETTYTVEGLNEGTIYEFAVKSYTDIEEEIYKSVKYSESVLVTTAGEPASVPAPEIKFENVEKTGKIKLTWNKVDGAGKYIVYRSTEEDGTYKKVYTAENESFINTSVVAGETYFYKVTAISEVSEEVVSEYSNVVGGTAKLARPTVSISNVESTGKPKLTWSAVDGADEYEVYRADLQTGEYKKVFTTVKTKYINTSAEAGKDYAYKVKAVMKAVEEADSAFSNEQKCSCKLERPVVSTSSVLSSGKPKITWDDVEKADKYEVYRATSKNGKYSRIYTTTKTSFTNTSAVAGNVYYYKVKAVFVTNSDAKSAFSTAKKHTCDLERPVVNVTLNAKGKPKLTWKKVDKANKYEVYRATSKDGKYSRIYTTTKTSFINTSTKAGKTYYYKVKAIYTKATAANSALSSAKKVTSK